ncbi:hypothetical protein D3C87_655990 [compost metagenome]
MMKRAYLALAVAGALLLAGMGLARCPAAEPVTPPAAIATPMPTVTAAASSSTAATLTNDLEIVIPPRRVAQNPYTTVQTRPVEPQTQQPRGEVVGEISPGPYSVVQEEPIIIRIKQTATAAASSEASASTMPAMAIVHGPMPQEHARLGAFIGTVPGAIALTYQLADVEIPPWVLGTPLKLGLDMEGNLSQVGAGVSVGGKAFVGAGGYVSWVGPGWYLGLGLRF